MAVPRLHSGHELAERARDLEFIGQRQRRVAGGRPGGLPQCVAALHEQRRQAVHVPRFRGLRHEPVEHRHGFLDVPRVHECPCLLGGHAGPVDPNLADPLRRDRTRQQPAVDPDRLVEEPRQEQCIGQGLQQVVRRPLTAHLHGASQATQPGLDRAVAQRTHPGPRQQRCRPRVVPQPTRQDVGHRGLFVADGDAVVEGGRGAAGDAPAGCPHRWTPPTTHGGSAASHPVAAQQPGQHGDVERPGEGLSVEPAHRLQHRQREGLAEHRRSLNDLQGVGRQPRHVAEQQRGSPGDGLPRPGAGSRP